MSRAQIGSSERDSRLVAETEAAIKPSDEQEKSAISIYAKLLLELSLDNICNLFISLELFKS